MHSFAVYYIEANLVCVIIFGILLIHNHFNIDRQEKQIKYDHVLLAFILYFLVDCFWAAIYAEIIPKTRFYVVSNVFLIYLTMAETIYFWLEYVMAYEQVPHRNRRINRFAVVFPFLVSTAALILNYLIAPQVLIDEELNTLPVYNVYLVTVPYIYMGAILFYTLRKAREEENPTEKRKHLFIGFFPLIAIIGGLVEMLFFPYIPIYCFVCLVMMLVFYIQAIELRISVDPLTKLNNRGQLTRYASQRANLFLADRLTVVIMMDIDGFKRINDTYGHAEGDKALVTVADSLRAVVSRHSMPSFLGRYGGDEFILIIHPLLITEADQMICEIRTEIEQNVSGTPYPLSVSAGYEKLTNEQDSIQSCIRRADKKLYLDKETRRRNPPQPATV